ncbi:MAG: hypothetical protein ACI965_000659 [Paraglaciecola sp.]|jgi:hypothetical protein
MREAISPDITTQSTICKYTIGNLNSYPFNTIDIDAELYKREKIPPSVDENLESLKMRRVHSRDQLFSLIQSNKQKYKYDEKSAKQLSRQ